MVIEHRPVLAILKEVTEVRQELTLAQQEIERRKQVEREKEEEMKQSSEALRKWEAVGVDQLIMGPSGTVYPHDVVEHAVALFGDEVIPRYDTDPEHSTSRYRRLAGTQPAAAAAS